MLVNNQISNTSFSIKIEFRKKSQIFSLVHQKSYPHQSLFKTFQIFLQLAKNSQENSHQISSPKLFKIQPINISSLLLLFFLSSRGFLFNSRPHPFSRLIFIERFRGRTRSVTMDGLQTRIERKRGEKTGMRIGAALI